MRNPQWKQLTPEDQLNALLSALEGNLSNLKNGVINVETYVKYQKKLIKQLEELDFYLTNPDQW